jgi:hypothetical protein
MPWGLRLTSTAADRAGLLALIEQAPAALAADWLVLTTGSTHDDDHLADDARAVAFALTDALRQDDALALARRGHDVVAVAPAISDAGDVVAGRLELLTLRDGARRPLDGMTTRRAQGLLAALPSIRSRRPALPAEAVFVVDEPGATALLLERLLLLQRDDARLCEVEVADDAGTARARLLVRVAAPPLWLVDKHVDDDEGVRVFLRGTNGPPALFVAAGWQHPLGDRLAEALAARSEIGLLGADGRLWRTRAPWPERSIHDVLRPTLPPSVVTLTPRPTTREFPVRLRLGAALPGDDTLEPELFLLDDTGLDRLQDFLETATPDEHQRLLLSRVGDAQGHASFVLREAVRAGSPPLGARLQTVLGVTGHVRVAGHEGLYVPPGRRLQPSLRRDDLRALLGLHDVAAVVIDEDADGLRLLRIVALDDQPVATLVRWRATSRRQELDRLLEDAVLAFPGVTLERPREEARVRLRDALDAEAARARRTRPAVDIRPAAPTTRPTPPARGDDAALRAREAALQTHALSSAGVVDATTWAELAQVKVARIDLDDAALCAATATFLDPHSPLGPLVASAATTGSLADLIGLDEPAPLAARRLCALLLQDLAHGRVDDDVARRAALLVGRADFPVSRRLQWTTLRALFSRNDDVIGLTRAREQILGALNARGLTEALDLPRFVRGALLGRPAGGSGGSGDDDDDDDGPGARPERRALLQRWLALLAGRRRTALIRAIVASGLGRLGVDVQDAFAEAGRDAATEPGGPVPVLVDLYASRLHFAVDGATAGAAEAWRAELERVLGGTARPEDRRIAEWLVKRSAWLRAQERSEPPLGLRPALERVVTAAVQRPDVVDLPAAIADVLQVRGSYDFEVTASLEKLLGLALQNGRDDVIERCARAASSAVAGVRIQSHRIRLLGAVVRAAATAGAADLVDDGLDAIAAIAAARDVPSTRDLVAGLRPAMLALRRLGELGAARRCLDAFLPWTRQSAGRETAPLAAALAEGYRELGDEDAAAAMFDVAVAAVVAPGTGHVDRFEAGVALCTALRQWPFAERSEHCAALLSNLEVFGDTFTTGSWFRAHQVLVAERLVDCIVDTATARSSRLQAWLDADEARIRSRILADCRAVVPR